jgi:hypothetical protein
MILKDRIDTVLHLLTGRTVCGMDLDNRWIEVMQMNLFFNPQNNIITSSSFIITKVMIQGDYGYIFGLEKFNNLLGPVAAVVAYWGWPFVVQIDFH